ncbi:hypothetical protein KR018_001630 [Drosophila ironensis]|nr:hypothetical protein KR018_001630 [Drosophila ironensis]
MKTNGYEEVIFTEQLWHHRCVGQQIESSRKAWERKCSWYPEAQKILDCGNLYSECLAVYGNDHFEYYAKKNRLRSKYRETTNSYKKQALEDAMISMDHLRDYKVHPTTNGDYGSTKPMKLAYCFWANK